MPRPIHSPQAPAPPIPTLPVGVASLETLVAQLKAAKNGAKLASGGPGIATKPKGKAKAKAKGKAKAKSAPKPIPKASPKAKAKAKASPKASPKAQAEPGQKIYADKSGQHITEAKRHRMYPQGCNRCRQVAGCTPSCWKKRKVE